MTTENKNPEDSTDNPRGNGGKNDSVDYESHRKLLDEKKKLSDKYTAIQSEFESLKAKIAASEEDKLKENNQWKEAYEGAKSKVDELSGKLEMFQTERTNAKKLNSFFDVLGNRIDQKYWNLIDIDKIQLEGDNVDEFSVKKYAEEFKTSFPEVITVKETRGMPNDSADPSKSGKLTYEQWMALPNKERPSRIKDVVDI